MNTEMRRIQSHRLIFGWLKAETSAEVLVISFIG